MGGIDVVIDDGSHVAEHQKISFDVLFPLVSDDGLYLCEDLHTSYWKEFQGGIESETPSLRLARTSSTTFIPTSISI
jgi:hypothetical protein